VCPKIAKTGPVDFSLTFFISIWEGFYGPLQGVLRGFLVQNALQYSLVIKLTHYSK